MLKNRREYAEEIEAKEIWNSSCNTSTFLEGSVIFNTTNEESPLHVLINNVHSKHKIVSGLNFPCESQEGDGIHCQNKLHVSRDFLSWSIPIDDSLDDKSWIADRSPEVCSFRSNRGIDKCSESGAHFSANKLCFCLLFCFLNRFNSFKYNYLFVLNPSCSLYHPKWMMLTKMCCPTVEFPLIKFEISYYFDSPIHSILSKIVLCLFTQKHSSRIGLQSSNKP